MTGRSSLALTGALVVLAGAAGSYDIDPLGSRTIDGRRGSERDVGPVGGYPADDDPEEPPVPKQRQVSTTRVIPAERQRLFDLVADPRQHPVIDGSGTVVRVRSASPERLYRGATFGATMQHGTGYRITNRVVEFDEGELIAWRHFHGHRWRYTFRDVDGGTEVTEIFDWSRARSKLVIVLAGYPRRNLRSMRETLARLEELAVTGVVADRLPGEDGA